MSVISANNLEVAEQLKTELGYTAAQILGYLYNHAVNITKNKLVKLDQGTSMLDF